MMSSSLLSKCVVCDRPRTNNHKCTKRAEANFIRAAWNQENNPREQNFYDEILMSGSEEESEEFIPLKYR